MDRAYLLERARRARGLTQAQLAAKAGTSQATLSAYERGLKSPSLKVAARIIAATGHDLNLRVHIDWVEHHPPGIVPFWAPSMLTSTGRRTFPASTPSSMPSTASTPRRSPSWRTRSSPWTDRRSAKDDPECYKEIAIGKVKYQRYSQNAIQRINDLLAERSADDVWAEYRALQKGASK